MRVLKYTFFILLFFNLDASVNAQSKNASFTPIFEDLPIDDPAKNSVLADKEPAAEKVRKNIFVTTSLNKSRCYIGEPILITYKLYSSLQSTSTIQKRPSFLGFIVSDIEPDNQVPEYKKVNGKSYRVFTIQQLQLISGKEGPVTIDPIVIENNIHYKGQGNQTHKYSGLVTGKGMNVIVDPLPVQGQPAGFSGSVGRFAITASVTSASLAAGENNILRIHIKGTGNFGNFSMPLIAWPSEIKYFSSSEKTEINENVFPPAGEKIFETPFVVSTQGQYILPAVSVSFFDPAKRTYETVKTEPIELKVLPALEKPTSEPKPIIPASKSVSIYYWLVAGVGVLVVIGLFIFILRKRSALSRMRIKQTEQMVSNEEEEKIDFKKEIQSVSFIAESKEYLVTFKSLLVQYLKFIMGNETAKEEELLLELTRLDPDMGALAMALDSECNFLLYAPASMDDATRKSLEERFYVLIDKGNSVGS